MRDEINDQIAARERKRISRRRHKFERSPYIPGAYDRLLAPREWQPLSSVLAFVIEAESYAECPEIGCSELTIIEHTRNGTHPAHHLCDSREPITLELMLADGRLAMIEITIGVPDAILTGCAHTPEDMFLDLREAAELLRFSGLEEPDDDE